MRPARLATVTPDPGGDQAAGRQHPGLAERQRAVGVAGDHERGPLVALGLPPKPATERGQHALGGVAVGEGGQHHRLVGGPQRGAGSGGAWGPHRLPRLRRSACGRWPSDAGRGRLSFAVIVEIRDLYLDGERLDDVAGRGRDPGRADDRRDRGEDAADPLGIEAASAAASRFITYEIGGASTAASAAMRTSMSRSGSRFEAATESAVMLASRSRTGASPVESGIGAPFRDVGSHGPADLTCQKPRAIRAGQGDATAPAIRIASPRLDDPHPTTRAGTGADRATRRRERRPPGVGDAGSLRGS